MTVTMTQSEARDAILAGTAPDGLTVRGDLCISGLKRLTTLSASLKVGGNLYINGCKSLATLPDDLTVVRNFYLIGCPNLANLPACLTVGGKLYINGCKSLATLPAGITAGGNLCLRNCPSLPAVYDDTERRYRLHHVILADGERFVAGCRSFTRAQAITHWSNPDHKRPDIAARYVEAINKTQAPA